MSTDVRCILTLHNIPTNNILFLIILFITNNNIIIVSEI